MKKILLLNLLLLSTLLAQAQTFVNINPENKNVVLEEFTGIYCGFCPDGHVVAQNIYNQNPADVVLINIHTGSYAAPNTGDPDFRTQFGSAIDGQANVGGYPAGTVNRHQFSMSQNGGTAMSRGDWSSASSQILNTPSYINVAAQSTIDISSRVLTVVVEAYYTGTPTPFVANSINVALLQNNVAGPQSGAANYNPSAIITGPWNPTYNHQHMLRHLITGQWGETIPTSIMQANGFYTNTFTYTIPQDLNGIAYDLFNLEVAVFVAEGQQEIITGEMSTITHIVPPGINLIDLSASTNMMMPSSYCDNTLTPEITVSNNSTLPVDTFEVSYTLNNNTPVTQSVYTSLAAGASTTVSFPTITIPSGTNNINFSSGTLNGTSYIDNVPNNNIATTGDFNLLASAAFATSHSEGFDSYSLATPAPSNAMLIEQNGNWVGVIDPTYTNGSPVGGFGLSPNAYRWRFGDFNNGEEALLIFDKLDFSNSSNNEMHMSFSHANANSWDMDRLQVLVSLDCGSTWNLAHEISGANLHTANNLVSSGNFYPTYNEWDSITVDLSAYDGESEVNIGIKAIKGGGNNVYIDDIDIRQGSATAFNHQYKNSKFLIYPNPLKDRLNIDGDYLYLEIYDLAGRLVFTTKKTNDIIYVTNIDNGTYMLNIYTKEECTVEKITINK